MLEKLVNKIKPKHYVILAFALGCIAMFAMLSYSELLSSGRFTVFNGDEFKLYAYIRMIWRSILDGESIRYSFTTSMGMDTSLILAYDFLSPFNIIYLLLYNADPRVAIALVFILKTGAAAAVFQLFASKGMKVENIASVIWAVLYSMCQFAVFFGLSNNMWADALYLLPLVCLCIVIAIRDKKYGYLMVAYAATFMIQFYMGYMIGMFSFLLFLLLLLTKKEISGKEKVRHLLFYLMSVLIAICVSAVVWVPALFWILQHTASDTGSFAPAAINIFDLIKRLFFGEISYAYSELPGIYCGIPCLCLVPGFFFQKGISKREKIIACVLLLFYVLAIFIVPLNAFLHAFDIPDGFSFRFAFVISFVLCAICVKESEFIEKLPRVAVCVALALMGLCYLVCMIRDILSGEREFLFSLILLVANVSLLAIWLGTSKLLKTKCTLACVILVILSITESVGNGCVLWHSLDKLAETTYENWSKNMNEVMADLIGDEDVFYRLTIQNDLCDNSDSFWGYYGISDFGTAEIPAERDFMRRVGFFTSAKLIHTTGITPVTEMLLGVKYRYVADNPYRIIGEAEPVIKKENLYYLPIGYVVNHDILDVSLSEGNAFENQNRLIEAMSDASGPYTRIPSEEMTVEENGLHLVSEGDSLLIVRDELGDAGFRMVFSSDIKGPVFVQFGYDHPGLYFASPIVENASNTMNLDMGAEDRQIRGSAVCEVGRIKENYNLSVKSYQEEDCPVLLNDLYLYELDEEKLQEAYERLNSERFHTAEVQNGLIRGSCKTEEENRVLFFSVPYLDGWEAIVNGKEAEIVPLVDDTFLGICLDEAGEYVVELRYRNPYVKYGVMLSAIGIFFGIICVVCKGILHKRAKSQNGDIE